MCIELWRVVIALAMFVVINAEILIVDPVRAEVAMHEGTIGFCWILQSGAERGTTRSSKGTLHFASISQYYLFISDPVKPKFLVYRSFGLFFLVFCTNFLIYFSMDDYVKLIIAISCTC